MSDFRLYPVPETKLDVLRGIFKQRIAEAKLTERSTVESCMESLKKGYELRYMAAYVDDVEDPQCCLIMAHFPGMATLGLMAHIALIYVCPKQRGKLEILNTLLSTAENYAKLNGAVYVAGTSWIYRGCKGTDEMWKSHGYEAQETIYVKPLT